MYLLSNAEVYCTGSWLSKLSNLYIFKLISILKSILEVDFLDLCIYVQTQKYIYILQGDFRNYDVSIVKLRSLLHWK